MTQKNQRVFIAYFLACVALFLSLVLWTRVFAGREAEQTPFHPVAADDGGGEVSSSGVRHRKEASEELTQWGLTQRYELSIPSLSVRAPVFVPDRKYWDAGNWDLLEQQMQVGLSYGVVTYPHAVPPGEQGTLIIAGHSSPPDQRAAAHSFGKIFEMLPDLKVGAEITVRFGTTSVTYEVADTMVVSPSDTTILAQQKDESLLKLITCYPVGTVKDRLVIIAKRK
ncbi:MAG: sortase [Candidatus Peribacteraceae bacterium]|nr:sortase [Candidatus Peribacteraceae bacterium]MDD5074837.1 sortase [Candidatus Peribacteraceae bacterium]